MVEVAFQDRTYPVWSVHGYSFPVLVVGKGGAEMTLADGLTQGIITPAVLDGSWVYVCGTCKQYLVYYFGKYHFVCSCHDDKL